MEYVVGMAEAKSKLAELVGRVRYGDSHYILERRGQPMAVLISLEDYKRLQKEAGATTEARPLLLPPEVQRRQDSLLAQARVLRARFGPPEQRLAELFADLPPESDEFWVEVLEAD